MFCASLSYITWANTANMAYMANTANRANMANTGLTKASFSYDWANSSVLRKVGLFGKCFKSRKYLTRPNNSYDSVHLSGTNMATF